MIQMQQQVMGKSGLLLVFLLLALAGSAQPFKKKEKWEDSELSPQAQSDRYLMRATTNKLAGWTMFGTGISLTLGGLAKMKAPAFENTPKSDLRLLWLPVAGLLTTAASIPIITSSKRLREKARLVLSDENVFIGDRRQPAFTYPSVGFRLQLK
ncbi:MAG TPA: hypothetical protein PKE63_11330 [Lacibacter sp.]|nr:hypothetical protein [Lacibacter sp.]HMO89756.1 hypothetical protein [Lacibacter sp.]HMP87863.1 hypothetical protein [Lacibacter sp.]